MVLIPVLIFSETPAFPIGLAVCAVLAVYEMLGCLKLRGSLLLSVPLYLSAAALPFLVRYLPSEELFGKIATAMVCLGVLYYFSVLVFSHWKYSFQEIGACFFSMLYILIGFTAIIYIFRFVTGGSLMYLSIFIGAWVTDTFAYFCGMLLGRGGKHKLIPDVSPKKTVEGAIGGIVFCVLAMILFGVIIESATPYHANLLAFAFAGLAASIVSQVGDLSMSFIKRTYDIKDYGKIFPGHGGIMDRFDSILAVAIVLMVCSGFFNFLY